MIHAPEGATHFRLKAGGAAMDFGKKDCVAATSESADLQLNITITPFSTNPLLLVFGIEFMQVLNGVEYRMVDRAYNAMAVVGVDGKRAD